MDENIWRFCQILMWFFGIQTTVLMAILGFMWKSMNLKFDNIDLRFDKVYERFDKIDARFDKVDIKIQALSDRVLVIETILANKEVCHFQEPKKMPKAQ